MTESLIHDLIARFRPTVPIAIFDVETTGTMPIDRVVQIAILRIGPDGAFEAFRSLVNPRMAIPAEATAVHGITDAMVAAAPSFAVLVRTITGLLEGCVLVAYNGRFDVGMVTGEYDRLQLPSPIQGAALIDPFRIFVKKEPRDLASAVQRYTGGTHEDAHDAMADVEATLAVLMGQATRYEDIPHELEALAAYCLPERNPAWLDPEGKFTWRNGEPVITFTKHAGRTLRELARAERGFCEWMLSKDFSDDVKTLVRDAIRGRFPTPPTPPTVATQSAS